MEYHHMGWDSPIQSDVVVIASNDEYASMRRPSAWISDQQVQEELNKAVDKPGFNTVMWTNRNHPSFATLDNILDHTNGYNEANQGISATSNVFPQQHQNLSSSCSSDQLSDYVLSINTPQINAYFADDHFSANESTNTNSNATNLHVEGNVISSNDNIITTTTPMHSSRKRKSPPAAAAQEMINFNGVFKKRKMKDRIELSFGSNINETTLDYSSSSAEGAGSGSARFSLIPSTLPKSSNINFKLLDTSSSETDAPDVETIAQMKEMIYRAAAFRPVNLGLDEVIEKPKRKNVKISSDPQTAAARQRRERISDRIRVLQRIVPGGNKMDTATMLDEAANYLKFLRSQVKALEKNVPITGGFGFSSYNFLP